MTEAMWHSKHHLCHSCRRNGTFFKAVFWASNPRIVRKWPIETNKNKTHPGMTQVKLTSWNYKSSIDGQKTFVSNIWAAVKKISPKTTKRRIWGDLQRHDTCQMCHAIRDTTQDDVIGALRLAETRDSKNNGPHCVWLESKLWRVEARVKFLTRVNFRMEHSCRQLLPPNVTTEQSMYMF